MTTPTLSRQRLWQLKHKELGLCKHCSQPAEGKKFCPQHREANRGSASKRELARKHAAAVAKKEAQ